MWKAKWIWAEIPDLQQYNLSTLLKKEFTISAVKSAIMKITADSYYRLHVNGKWVADGPCRSWPEHYQYDVLDIGAYLKNGENEIYVLARYFGAGTFHQVPRQAGVLAQLELETIAGEKMTIATDSSWQAAEAGFLMKNAPKVSIQMEPQELVDVRQPLPELKPAREIAAAENGFWRDLQPRDVAELTRNPFTFTTFRQANLLESTTDITFCLPSARLLNPGQIEANYNISQASGMATLLDVSEKTTLQLYTDGFEIAIDGRQSPDNHFELDIGTHLLLAFVNQSNNHIKEQVLRFLTPSAEIGLTNPLQPTAENPWCWIPFPEFQYCSKVLEFALYALPEEITAKDTAYKKFREQLLQQTTSPEVLLATLGEKLVLLTSEEMFVPDPFQDFFHRHQLGDAGSLLLNPSGLMHDNSEITTILPAADGVVEVVYDLGEQNCGYYEFDLHADEGVTIDIFSVEYITPDGTIQHSINNRNGLRYVTQAGNNHYLSVKRRSGRYVFMTFRNMHNPVKVRLLQLIESTYPVDYKGHFSCSDIRLDKIWEISARTLKLCMEDTFTDCPLYEQTLWVGDSRNEALYAYPVFGATDIARRCIRLAGQSLERFPIVGSQVPSSWDCILPAWSFLWGIMIWDYYFYSEDIDFLKESHVWAIRNLKGAVAMLDENGLFKGAYWNMFDWTGIDDQHEVVLHNSMLMVGAIDAAIKSARVLELQQDIQWLEDVRSQLVIAVNACWDVTEKTFPDSIHENGAKSKSTSVHTNFLALLYDILPKDREKAALDNLFSPPEGMVQIGAPFAMQYFYEMLVKYDFQENIIESIYDAYLPMLQAGATTVWETFPSSTCRTGGFPTRSHCHAWSSTPLYFFNRIILGINQVEPGGRVFEISPRLCGLTWAKGAMATARGILSIDWSIHEDELRVSVSAPPDIQVRFMPNESIVGLKRNFTRH